MSNKKVKLNILGLSYSQTQSGAYALVLAEEEGERRIPIIIGGVEAQSIAIKLEGLEPPRPLTHDLFLNFSKSFEIEIQEVVIYKLEEGIFYSELVCKRGDEILHIDSRTSDAVALALRFECPIYTYEDIIEKAGIVLDFENKEEQPVKKTSASKPVSIEKYKEKSTEELKRLLQEAIEGEDYERASEIRDEINSREE
ncbi:bifunctional nuclease family protein [Carboxylicivirga linearis]|uniref:Bifunctional nuclease family protein n=1 Tax=Carboxylicivirga linearis TaxID=1628157 RepID=A0ABS5JQB4_9BACT|nr:bifunctional nuclease family protein [Carboxylicivirga linearis]MBS2096998.1 bifunctional nuclease family protein [Carboxylicivirga linearis]